MPGVQVDPDKLLDLANSVNANSYSPMLQTQQLVQACSLDAQAFGVIGSAIMGGSYESARSDFEQAAAAGAQTIYSGATGLANVATLYSQAENANTATLSLSPLSNTLSGAQTGGHDGAGTFALGLGGFAAEVALTGLYAIVMGGVETCAALTPVAFAAVVMWGLTKPDDTEINQCLSNWGAASTHASESRTNLQQILRDKLEDAWPSGDGARPAFDAWMSDLDGNLAQYQTAIANVVPTISAAASDLHQANEAMLGVVLGAVATLIALTSLDIFFGAGEGAKTVVGAFLVAAIGTTSVTITAVLGKMVVDIALFIKDAVHFADAHSDGSMPTFQSMPNPLGWQTDPPPGTGPQLVLGGTGGSGSGSGDSGGTPPR